MSIKRLIAVLSILIASFLYSTAPASAHVLVSAKNNVGSAILHITPGDDPVALEKSSLFFDVDTGGVAITSAHLKITNQTTQRFEELATGIKDSGVSSAYTFPSKDLYLISLVINRGNGQLEFTSSVRITRSVASNDGASDMPTWATIGAVLAVWGIAALAITAFQRRKSIDKYSHL